MADETRADTCQWRYYDPPYLSDYETQCGQAFTFNEGGLAENHVRYCHWCGGRVIPPTPPLSDEGQADA